MKTALISSLFLSSLLVACSPKAQEIVVHKNQLPIYTVEEANTNTTQEYPASIQGSVDIEIRPQISGIIVRVLAEEGSYVQKGQQLFKINDAPFREALNQASANLNAAKAAVLNTQIELDKLSPLVENKVISDFQLRSAQAAHALAQANVQQAQALVESARINLAYTDIKAPVSGYIGRLPKKQGSIVSSADLEALTKLSDVSKVFVYFALGEVDFIKFKSQYAGATLNEKIKNTDPVTLILADQQPYQETGRIDLVDGQFDKNTGAITLRASFPNKNGLLRSGNTGKIRLAMMHSNALTIPQEATMEIQDKTFVFTVDASNKVAKQLVQITGRAGTDYVIGAGLKVGDRIVLRGFENLTEGEQIDVVAGDKALASR